jgi:hypothetical protein
MRAISSMGTPPRESREDAGVPEFAWGPGAGDAGCCDDGAELAADVGGVQLVAVAGGEHQLVLPVGPAAVGAQGGDGELGQGQGAAGQPGFGVAAGAD